MPGKKLLVADDSLTIQKVIRLALTNSTASSQDTFEIQTVADGTDAVQQISLFRPDVVLIDVSLPGKSAFEVKREINQHDDLDEVRFVLMSSAFEKVDEAQAEEVKFHGRLTKPFDPTNLRQVISDSLNQVVAKRMEKTAFVTRPTGATPPPFRPSTLPPPPPLTSPVTENESVSIFPPLSALASPQGAPELSEPPMPPPPLFDPGMPPLPSGIQETSEQAQELWESGEDIHSALIPPPNPSPISNDLLAVPPVASPGDMTSGIHPIPGAGEGESDIKSLTESTIKITGLDDYDWNVKEPTLKPLPGMTNPNGTTFQVEPPRFRDSEKLVEEPSMPPFIPGIAEERGTRSQLPKFSPEDDSLLSSDQNNEPTLEPNSEVQKPEPPVAAVTGLAKAEMEALVRDQVHSLLEKMAQQLLPEMAEKIIKDEIHKMLSGPS